jgi:hypothetical protein
MERLWIREARRAARPCNCSVRLADRFELRRGRGRNDGRHSFAAAVEWRSGTSCVGRSVGSGWLCCHLERALHLSPVEVSS